MSDKKILVVDDEPYSRRALALVLEKAGYDVASASNGEEALTKARESKPDLMFLDVRMPRMNGYEVCEALKSDPGFRDIYIIMLSDVVLEAGQERALNLGANEFLTKPFSPAQVVAKVKELVGQPD